MGVVVEAHHVQLDEKVAIKLLLPEALADTEVVARFSQESRAVVKIKNDHVVRVIDVGTLDSGAPFMVMEYLDGLDLGTWLERRGPLPIEQTVDFVLQTCEALADAHTMGIVHRDLKPSNLFCVRSSDSRLRIKVLDFGVSKVLGKAGADLRMTKTQTVMGSPLYMSPEQMQSARNVDLRTDIWSMGAVMFELLTGKPPFPGETFSEVCAKAMAAPAPELRQHMANAPRQLERVITRCLQKDRTRRYANVADLAQDLAPVAPRTALPAVERICAIVGAAGSSAASVLDGSRTTMPSAALSNTMIPPLGRTTPSQGGRRLRPLTAAVVGGIAVSVGVAGYYLFGADRHMARAPAASVTAPTTTPTITTATPPVLPSPVAKIADAPDALRQQNAAPSQPPLVGIVPARQRADPVFPATAAAVTATRPTKARKKPQSGSPSGVVAKPPRGQTNPAPGPSLPTDTVPKTTRRWKTQL
jgi:serine/threonine-protein kinase